MSPEKRFPVKVSNQLEETPQAKQTRTISIDDAMRENQGLKHAIDIFEDDESMLEANDSSAMNLEPESDTAGPDDTMVSTFSDFSAIPDMTMFAKLRQSPTKSLTGGLTPRVPKYEASPSETPRPVGKRESGNTTNLLIDFTEQLRYPQKSPDKRGTLQISRTTPFVPGTPSRQLSNLLDFDIPPIPTPRSVPSITPRELESLKSKFLSEISSLKASLSGKEAEVHSLKTAVGDAEKRVGESLEKIREGQIAKDELTHEKQEWENRGREMESVLRKVKDEIMLSHREREELEQKLDESEKRREAAEMLHQEAESKMAGMRAGRDSDRSSPEKAKSTGGAPNNSHEIEVAVERVARELHGLYKSKHETKVAALKKSYESRWQKKINELESRIDDLCEENEKLRVGRDATMTKVDPNEAGQLKARAVKDNAAIKELEADIQRLEAVVATVQKDNESLRGMLEQERIEKGELVQLAEEMMSMQSFVGASYLQQPVQQSPNRQRQSEPSVAKTPKANAEFRSSISRASGLKAPGTSLRAPHERTKSGGLPRPGVVGRSGIMSSIERMGSYRGRGD